MEYPVVSLANCCVIKPPKAEARAALKPDDLVSFVPMDSLGINKKVLKLEKTRALADVSGSYTYFAENDVLLAKITPCFENGKLGIATGLTNGIGFGSSEFIVFRPNEHLNSEYLYYFLNQQSFRDAGQAVMTGAVGHKRVPKDFIQAMQIPLPPIPEQQRIVAILDQAFADIEKARANAEKNLKNARELFDSYAQKIFSQKTDGWQEATIGQLGKVSMCKRILKQQTSAMGDIPFYKIGTFGKEANAFIPAELFEEYKNRYSFPKLGDVLISASGTIGRCVVYNGEPAYFQDSNIVWIDNDEKLVSNEYLLHFYRVCDWNPSRGATISRLYNDDLRKIKISFPAKSEQTLVSKNIAELDQTVISLQRIYTEKLKSLDELKKSLLQKAFSGELTKTEGQAA
jgi:type I restriction enzyme S subunit